MLKTLKEIRSRIMEIDTRFADMADTIAKENRSLNDDEKKEQLTLAAERDQLSLRAYKLEHPTPAAVDDKPQVTMERAFTEVIRSMASNQGIPEQYESLRSDDGGLKIPMVRATTPQTSGSVSVITPVTVGDIIEALHPGEVISQLGLKIQTLQGQWNFPVVAGATAEWADENVEISDKAIDITKISPSPKRLAISVPISNRAIYQSGGQIRTLVLQAINNAITTAFNVAMLTPTRENGSKAPAGAFVGLTATTLKAAITRADVLGLMKSVYKTGVKSVNPVFVAGSTMFFTLAETKVDEGSGRFLLENITYNADGTISGVMLGVKVVMSDYVGANSLGFGNWGYELLGMFGNASLTIDGTSAAVAKKNLTYFVMNVDADMLRLRDEAFGIINGVPA